MWAIQREMAYNFDMSPKLPQVIILLGPVGAGKSTVGRIIEKELNGHFYSIEELFIQKFKTYENYASNRDQAYQIFMDEVIHAAERGQTPLIFEEIAMSSHGKGLVESISQKFSTDLICIEADLETCQSRVIQRGTAKNFSKSNAVVEGAWTEFSKVKDFYRFKAEIRNQDCAHQEIADQVRKIWK